jgi:hypothetical protein
LHILQFNRKESTTLFCLYPASLLQNDFWYSYMFLCEQTSICFIAVWYNHCNNYYPFIPHILGCFLVLVKPRKLLWTYLYEHTSIDLSWTNTSISTRYTPRNGIGKTCNMYLFTCSKYCQRALLSGCTNVHQQCKNLPYFLGFATFTYSLIQSLFFQQ